jgi:hypothetical protein
VAFAGFETLPLYLHDPRVNVTMANAFYLNYTLSESALRGSVQLLLVRRYTPFLKQVLEQLNSCID